jgi:RHH-type transcriptional regulator, rel operon repressor / antitoxin RelB
MARPDAADGEKMSTSIQLDPVTEQRLERLVRQTGRAKADYLSEWIANGLEEIEDAELAAAVMERVRKGQEKIYSAEEVRKDLGLDD